MVLELEPEGILFTEIRFMNHRVERRAKLQRQKKIFRQKVFHVTLKYVIHFRYNNTFSSYDENFNFII